ncbi:ABC-2 type transport system ATP-binding protein [Ekhidna lutea]|uniref:ABC-2 type transport system ATP-binding protein n=1 Tax=Ekhidna lutea TaxID=447679 RepID=A0A239M126_EKHLU|nr:ATP-binding cassette domain-containing protein [Ekhidna lutea]SNT36325.1 ABC-2 type transport system ATP-binding protein [Ekhidna lutea]
MSVLKINKLTKKFGKLTAVDQLDLTIEEGQVYGILGPNGSGKTTTLGMILEVVAPSSGSFEWFGGVENVAARQKIGAILETPCFYSYLTAVQNLRIVAHIKKCGTSNIDNILKQVNLFERRNDKFKNFSLGMKQRLSLAAALLSDPPVLMLDEPTNGLDPEGIAEVRQLIRDIAAQGKTIIMASHLLDEVQKVCTDFCILRKGVKLHEGSVHEILGETNVVEISSTDLDQLTTTVSKFEGLEKLEKENGSLKAFLKEGQSSDHLNRFCFDQGIALKKLIPQSKSLEQEFLKILKEND